MSDLQFLKKNWPSAIVSRTAIYEFSGGIFSEKYLANLDSIGKGPKRGRIGRKVFYKVDDLVAWMELRLERKEIERT
ncbi:MAG: hypothetical protein U9O82_01025 [Thermodesulfobacteriota bacterium]|nr:hypothetical protein [Thermodesulfobacteriota bacterium]